MTDTPVHEDRERWPPPGSAPAPGQQAGRETGREEGRSARSDVVAVLLLTPVPTLGVLAGLWLLRGPIGQSLYGLAKVWILLLPFLWTRWVDLRRVRPTRPSAGPLLLGLATGVAIAAGIVLAYVLVGEGWVDVALFRDRAREAGFGTPGRYLALAVWIALVNSLLEEYVWRWFLVRKIEGVLPSIRFAGRAGVPAWTAVPASAAFFTVHHIFALAAQFPWQITAVGSAGVFAGGCIWSWTYARFRSIWPGYVCHVLADAAILAIGWRILFGGP